MGPSPHCRRLEHYPQALFVGAFEAHEHVDHVSRDEQHRGESHEPAYSLAPAGEHVVAHGEGDHLDCTEQEHPSDDERGEHHPAHLPPYTGFIANHLLDVVIELVHTITPGYGDALKEDQEEQTHSTGGVVVKQLEDVDPTLCDVRQADDVGDQADNSNEELSSASESPGKLIHQSSDEALHRAELAVNPQHQQH